MSCPDPDLYIRQGDDVTFSVAVVDDAGDPYDLSTILGASCVVKGSYGTADITLTKTLGAGITVTAPGTLGELTVTLTRVNTATLKAGTQYALEMKLQLADSSVVTIVEGTAEVQPQLLAVLI